MLWLNERQGQHSYRYKRTNLLTRLVALVCVILLVATPVTSALAYYNFGTVGISVGSSSLTVKAGDSVSTSVSANPSSDSQTLGCGMAKCPQVCDSEEVIEAGYHCFDSNGQCTCAGKSYSTYYTELSASSSNSGVATAYISGGTLVVKGVSAGTATITVNASLRQWTSNSTSIKVTVTSASSSSGSSGSSSSSGNSGSSGSSHSSGSSSSSSNSSSSSASSNSSSSTVTIPEAAESVTGSSEEEEMTVTETTAGTFVQVPINSETDSREALSKVAGEDGAVIFWYGSSYENPEYSLTFYGDELSEDDDSNFDFDPSITVSETGTGDVANIMEQAKDGLVLDFAYQGDFPSEATVSVKVDSEYTDGTELSMFEFNEDTRSFDKIDVESVVTDDDSTDENSDEEVSNDEEESNDNGESNDAEESSKDDETLTVTDDYVVFKVSSGATYALSTDDLSAYEVQETNTPLAASESSEDNTAEESQPEEESTNMVPYVAAILVAIACVAIVIVAVVIWRKRKAAAALSSQQALEEEAQTVDMDSQEQTSVLDENGDIYHQDANGSMQEVVSDSGEPQTLSDIDDDSSKAEAETESTTESNAKTLEMPADSSEMEEKHDKKDCGE